MRYRERALNAHVIAAIIRRYAPVFRALITFKIFNVRAAVNGLMAADSTAQIERISGNVERSLSAMACERGKWLCSMEYYFVSL